MAKISDELARNAEIFKTRMGGPAGVLIGERMQKAITQIQVASLDEDQSRIKKLKERRQKRNLQRKEEKAATQVVQERLKEI